MALGRLIDFNLATTATFEGGETAAELPLANLGQDERFIMQPARFINPQDPSTTKFIVNLAQPRLITTVGFLFNTLGFGAHVKVTVAGLDGNLALPAKVIDWTPVFSTFYPFGTVPFGEENWFSGQVAPSELDLYRRHKWLNTGDVLASRLLIEMDDSTTSAEAVDVGGLLVAPSFSATLNYDRGRDLALIGRDVNDEGPSGRIFSESREVRRQLSVRWSMLTTAEAQRFIDAGMRGRTSRTVFFIPDIEDEIALMREAFPARFEKPPGAAFQHQTNNSTAAVLKEILA